MDRKLIGSVYTCEVENELDIIFPNMTLIRSASGTHKTAQSNDDVKAICMDNRNTLYFPKGLEKIFRNLRRIRIAHGRLEEITQADFQPFPWLVELTLNENDIKVLENGIFEHNFNLSYVNLEENKIVHVGENVFEYLTKMTQLIINRNDCTLKTSLTDNMSIMQMKKLIKDSCRNSEFLDLESQLIALEDEHRFVESENLLSFTVKVDDFNDQFQNSSFSNLTSISDRISDLYLLGSRSYWILKDKVESSERTINDLKLLSSQQNQNWIAEVNPMWIQIIVAFSAIAQILISSLVLCLICLIKN